MLSNQQKHKPLYLNFCMDRGLRAGTALIDTKTSENFQQKLKDGDFSSPKYKDKIFQFETNQSSMAASHQQFRPKQFFGNIKDKLEQKIIKTDSHKFLQTSQINQNLQNNKFNYEKIGSNFYKINNQEKNKQMKDMHIKSLQYDYDQIRPQTNMGGQRRKIKIKHIQEQKLPQLIKEQVQFPKQQLQNQKCKNVQQLLQMHKNLGDHTQSTSKFNFKNEQKFDKNDSLDNFFDQDIQNLQDLDESDKEDFLKIIVNDKRDQTKDTTQNILGFETNLDPEFLNLFVLDA